MPTKSSPMKTSSVVLCCTGDDKNHSDVDYNHNHHLDGTHAGNHVQYCESIYVDVILS